MARETRDAEFDEFVRASWRRLSQAAYALTGNRHDAEDLLQSVLERTYLRWSNVKTDPVAYARRALVHKYVDGWRRRRRIQMDPSDSLSGDRCRRWHGRRRRAGRPAAAAARAL